MSWDYKKDVKYENNQMIYFFWKTGVYASKVIMNSSKTLDFDTPIPFDTFFWQQ